MLWLAATDCHNKIDHNESFEFESHQACKAGTMICNGCLMASAPKFVLALREHARKIPVLRRHKGDHPRRQSTLVTLSCRMWQVASASRNMNQDLSCGGPWYRATTMRCWWGLQLRRLWMVGQR